MTKKSLENVSVALRDNSYDFIDKGLEAIMSDNQREYKYAILHLYSGVLLFLKDILYKEHWTLIFQDVNQANKSKLLNGDINSVNFDTLTKRLKTTEIFNLSPELLDDLNWLRKQRNKIEHLHNEINPHEVKSRIANTLINILNTINNHKTSLGFTEDDYFENYEYDYIEFINLFQINSFAFDEFIIKRNKIIASAVSNSYLVINCPNCEQPAMELNPDNDFVLCHFCLNRLSIEAFLTLNVSGYFNVLEGGQNKYNCPECTSNLIFQFQNKEICFECFSSFEIHSLEECTKCGSTFVKNDEYLSLCDNCIEYMLQHE